MQLNDLKPAWRQMKLLNAMQPMDSDEVLSIIAGQQKVDKANYQGIALKVIMFIVLTFFCQGG